MKKVICLCIFLLCLSACRRYEPPEGMPSTTEENTTVQIAEAVQLRYTTTTADETLATTTNASELVDKEVLPARRKPVKVKGIYVSAYVAGSDRMMEELLIKIDQSEINTIVIDVKNDEGQITFTMDTPLVNQIGSGQNYITDINELITKLKEHNLYVIARVVAFRDPFLAEQRPAWSLQKADGSLYRDRNGMAWINPYKKEVWDYLVTVSKEAHSAGFDEIQFDYVRFSTEKGMNEVVFQDLDTNGRNRTEIITEFINYAYEQLKEDIYVSADVFGTIIGSEVDAHSIGQVYSHLATTLDYISPMIYPSHYSEGNFGLSHPDLQPYETVLAALQQSQQELNGTKNDVAAVRPWLQDFTASYLTNYREYGAFEVQEQIQAVYDAGYEEWILWNASCNYSWEAVKLKTSLDFDDEGQ